MAAMTAEAAPSTDQFYTRGGANVPDTRGPSMVARHLEKQQKEKEARAMERLHLLLPALGPTLRAVALEECGWDEERALTMLRRFQVAKAEELSKLHKERRRHQLALQSGKLERRRSGKEEKKPRRDSDSGSGSEGGSGGEGSGSDSESPSGSGSGSEGSSEDERSRKKGSKRRRSGSRERSAKRGKREGKDKKRSGKDRKRKREKEKRGKKDRKEKRRSKDKAKAKEAAKGAIGQEYGKYGIIRETDMYSKRPEFQLWAMEVKGVDLEAMPRGEEKEMFRDYMEEYNTATLPHRKYYDLELYEKQRAAKAQRRGTRDDEGEERFVFNDEEERKREMAAERARLQAERMKQAYEELKTTDKAKDMREQQLLRSRMELAYKTGDRETAEKLQKLLEPVDLAELNKPKRPPASGT